MRPKSKTLFHFTRGQGQLKSILEHGFRPMYCLEDVRWMEPGAGWFIAFPMVCFCDIPLSRIQEHVDFYGSFGLGLTNEWANTHGLNPVMYLASDNHISRSFMELNEHANKLCEPDNLAAKVTMRYMTAFSKPMSGQMEVDGKPHNKEFYLESEWRYVPKHEEIPEYLKRAEYDDPQIVGDANVKVIQHCSLPVMPSDIRYIFVESDTDIPQIIDFIQNSLPSTSPKEVSLLVSKVTSLERLREDV